MMDGQNQLLILGKKREDCRNNCGKKGKIDLSCKF